MGAAGSLRGDCAPFPTSIPTFSTRRWVNASASFACFRGLVVTYAGRFLIWATSNRHEKCHMLIPRHLAKSTSLSVWSRCTRPCSGVADDAPLRTAKLCVWMTEASSQWTRPLGHGVWWTLSEVRLVQSELSDGDPEVLGAIAAFAAFSPLSRRDLGVLVCLLRALKQTSTTPDRPPASRQRSGDATNARRALIPTSLRIGE